MGENRVESDFELFAKTVIVDSRQVLCYLSYDAELDETIVHHIFHLDGIEMDLNLTCDGEQQTARARATFDKFDEVRAREIIEKVDKFTS